jgi:hypothetical protein
MEWAAIGAICAAITVFGLLGLWIWRLATRLAETDAKAKSAEIMAAGLGAKLSTVERDLANHKEHVAQEYVTREALSEVTNAINSLSDRIGARLDSLFLHFLPKP